MAEKRLREDETLEQSSDEDDIEKLEEEVKLMAEKIAGFRETLPGQLQNTLASILAAQRPVNSIHSDDGSNPGPSSNPNQDAKEESGALAEEDPVHVEKMQMIKQKISSNASAMPLLLKRMKDCMSRIDKLESFNDAIHPAFKRKRTS